MGKGRYGFSFAQDACSTLGGAIRTGRQIKALCMSCPHRHVIEPKDMDWLLHWFGPDYRLLGRRYQCSKCGGWMRLNYCEGGVWWPLWTDADSARWDAKDRAARAGPAS